MTFLYSAFANVLFTAKFLFGTSLFVLIVMVILLPLLFMYFKLKLRNERSKRNTRGITIGIFHPYCNAGGGGEKVLWVAIQALHRKYPKAHIYVYTGDIEFNSLQILNKVRKNLNVELEAKNVKFIYLTRRRWVEGDMYPFFTLLGQALGSVYLGIEAIMQLNPDIYIETTGFTFTLPIFKYLGGCKTACYVHYPLITKEMIKRVMSRRNTYNNREYISNSPTFTYSKLLYYNFLAWVYSLAGQCSDITLVNSTFTHENLTALWNCQLHLVYPPCEVEHLKKIQRNPDKPNRIRILSLAQFRPEKDHHLQLQAMYELREMLSDAAFDKVTLVMCGSCRNDDDQERVKDLQDFAKYLSLENHVEFKVNVSYSELLEEFRKAYIGIHTMLDEHFGISVVEQMAAGLIMVAHRSGGPLLDIIETSEGSRLGFLAVHPDEFASKLRFIIESEASEMKEIRDRAKASVDRFSTKKFQEEFLRATEPLFK